MAVSVVTGSRLAIISSVIAKAVGMSPHLPKAEMDKKQVGLI